MSEEVQAPDGELSGDFEHVIVSWMARSLPGFLAHEVLREAEARTQTAIQLKEIGPEGHLVVTQVVDSPTVVQASAWLLTSARRAAECSFLDAEFAEVLKHFTVRMLSCALEVILTLRQRGHSLPETPEVGGLAPDAGLLRLIDFLWSAGVNEPTVRPPTRYRLLTRSEKLVHAESGKSFSIADQSLRYLAFLDRQGGLPAIDAVCKADAEAPSRPSDSRKILLERLRDEIGESEAAEFFDKGFGGGFSLGVDLEIIDQ
jgi:hypothetical protein